MVYGYDCDACYCEYCCYCVGQCACTLMRRMLSVDVGYGRTLCLGVGLLAFALLDLDLCFAGFTSIGGSC